MATTITAYGGVNTIGGNQILLEDGETRLLFDFGIPFGKRNRYFEEYLKPRSSTGLLDFLELGLIPPLEGLYRPDLELPGLWDRFRTAPHYRNIAREGRPPVDGVLLSHAHLDHSGYISLLQGNIPIYSSVMTAFISKVIQDAGPADIAREMVYYTPRETDNRGYLTSKHGQKIQRPYAFLQGQGDVPPNEPAVAFWNNIPDTRTDLVTTDLLGDMKTVGGLPVTIYPIDHSIVGASAFAVQTSAGWVVYTGDIRRHGQMDGITEEFIDKVAALNPVALITEGTRAGVAAAFASEREVRNRSLDIVTKADGFVIADIGARNFERIVSYWEIAQLTGRRLVITTEDAYLFKAIHHAWFTGPRVEDIDDILVYDEAKDTENDWERELRSTLAGKLVTPREIKNNPRDYILCFSFKDAGKFVDLEPRGGIYIYSSSEVYDEDMAPDVHRLRNWLAHFDIKPIGLPRNAADAGTPPRWEAPPGEDGLHASGHSTGEELLDMARRINPRIVVPVHTQHPEFFVDGLRNTKIDVRAPSRGEAMELG